MTELPYRCPTTEELNVHLRRAARERSDAFYSIMRWLRNILKHPLGNPVAAKVS